MLWTYVLRISFFKIFDTNFAWSKTPYIRRLAPIKIWLALLQSLSEQKELNLDFISRYSIGFILFILGKFCICTSSYLALK